MAETETKTPLEANSDAIAEIMTLANSLPSAGGGTDISLGVTGASVGDIVKVKAVDAEGKPTEWEAAGWRKIREFTIPEDISADTTGIEWNMSTATGHTNEPASFKFDTDMNSNPFSIREIYLYISPKKGSGSSSCGLSDQNGGFGDGANLFVDGYTWNRGDDGYFPTSALVSLIDTTTISYLTTPWSYAVVKGAFKLDRNSNKPITAIKYGMYPWVSLGAGSKFAFWGR